MSQPDDATVRIYGSKGIAGMGFLVEDEDGSVEDEDGSPQWRALPWNPRKDRDRRLLVENMRVLTCAHVIDAALGREKEEWDRKPERDVQISLDFPLIQTPGPKVRILAHVVDWQPRNGQDIARLMLDDEPPVDAKPVNFVRLVNPVGHKVRAFGFPRGKSNGVSAEGRLSGLEAQGLREIKGSAPQNYFVQPGFSGSPVWVDIEGHSSGGGVVGMIVAADLQADLQEAYMIPAERLVKYRLLPYLSKETLDSYAKGKITLTSPTGTSGCSIKIDSR